MEKIKQALERAKNDQKGKAIPGVDIRPGKSRHAEDVQKIKYQETRVFDIDPAVLARNKIIIGSKDNLPAQTGYKILRTQIEQRLAAKGWNAVAVTSPGSAVGKTTTAINLSVALAKEMHRTVLLVDLDFNNPSVHERFECQIDKGLIDYLIDDVPVSEILINPGIERLVLLPAGGTSIENSSELIASPKMIKLVDELKSRYPSRIIVFDLPPLLWSDDTLAFSPYVDTTLLVVSEGITSKEELRRAMEYLEGHEVIGTVINRSNETNKGYYSDYG